jgi:hypothetical protein
MRVVKIFQAASIGNLRFSDKYLFFSKNNNFKNALKCIINLVEVQDTTAKHWSTLFPCLTIMKHT